MMRKAHSNGDRRDPAGLEAGDPPLGVLRGKGPRVRRLDALAKVRGHPAQETLSELRRIGADAQEDVVVRAAAISMLSERGEGVSAEEDPPVTVAAAQRKAAEVIATRRLVASFERRDGALRLAPVSLLNDPPAGRPIEQVPTPQHVVTQVARAASLEIGAEGVPTSHRVILLRCDGRELAIVAKISDLDPVDLLQRPARPAQLAVHHLPEHDVWTVPFEVLTEPADGRIRIAVIDARGRTRYAGTGIPGAHGIEFTVQTAVAPGATAVIVRGVLSSGEITLIEGRSGRHATNPRSPQRVRGTIPQN